MFSEILINNREKLKEAESFVLTLQKDKTTPDKEKKNKCEENIKFRKCYEQTLFKSCD